MADKTPFSGKGFDKEPLSEDENAAHREMFREVSEAWSSLSGIDQIGKAGGRLARIIAILGALGGAIAFAVKQGLFS